MSISDDMKSYAGHLFRSDYQHKVEKDIFSNLPIDQCAVVMDFSENISLDSQDQIESAHWATKQVTLHPIYIVQHDKASTEAAPVLKKESLIIISDSLAHNANTVFVFTKQLILHLKHNPGPKDIKLIHRFSDNCAQQYKCINAFSHICQFQDSNDIEIIYHFTEAGHGKGPSDGLGAVVKKRLERMILGGTVINNAYQAYLALTQSQQNQRILYVPRKKIQKEMPQNLPNLKSVKGTQSYHMIRYTENGLFCQDLSCSCTVCILGAEGPCFYSQYRHEPRYHKMNTSQDNSACNVEGGGFECTSQNEVVALNVAMVESARVYQDHREQVEHKLRQFSEGVNTKGWTIHGETPEDGNCLFWALSDQLHRIDENHTHTALREMAVRSIASYSQEQKSELANFLTDGVEAYLDSMGREGTYADHVCIQALSRALKCDILIIQSTQSDILLSPTEEPRARLVIGYIPTVKHYVSLEPLNRYEPGDFIAVCLESLRKKKHIYIAKVLSADGSHLVEVKFLKRKTNTEYIWPHVDDTDSVNYSEILMKLTMPELLPGRGLTMKFTNTDINTLKGYKDMALD